MIAVVDILGDQLKVEQDVSYNVPKLKVEPDSEIYFDSVMLVSDGKKTEVGQPYVKNAKVKAVVVEHLKDDKVIVFKKKRRKGYQKKGGHRQQLTKIKITGIEK